MELVLTPTPRNSDPFNSSMLSLEPFPPGSTQDEPRGDAGASARPWDLLWEQLDAAGMGLGLILHPLASQILLPLCWGLGTEE